MLQTLCTLPKKWQWITFYYILPVERHLKVSSNNQPAYWNATYLGSFLPTWKFPDEMTVCAHRLLPQELLGRSPSKDLRNALIKTYCTPVVL